MNNSTIFQQVDLLLRILPHVMSDERVALKGGSAINLFVRDLPRLSVDIDLTYLVLEDRKTSLENISSILLQAATNISQAFPTANIQPLRSRDGRVRKLIVNSGGAIVKVEPNETIRGTVFPCEVRDLCWSAQERFELFLSARTLSVPNLYGGKICAALARQHPRDIFDIKILFENEGLTEEIRKAFLIYLISHNRPMHEVLNPNLLDLENVFEREFRGMTATMVTAGELCDVRQNLIQRLQAELTTDERRFLVSVKEKNSDWSLIGIEGIENLPAVKWKMQNIAKMSKQKHSLFVNNLKQVLKLD